MIGNNREARGVQPDLRPVALRQDTEVCRIYYATANPVQVIVAATAAGRGILGVVDGASRLRVEDEADIAAPLGAPGNPELGIGAIAEGGVVARAIAASSSSVLTRSSRTASRPGAQSGEWCHRCWSSPRAGRALELAGGR